MVDYTQDLSQLIVTKEFEALKQRDLDDAIQIARKAYQDKVANDKKDKDGNYTESSFVGKYQTNYTYANLISYLNDNGIVKDFFYLHKNSERKEINLKRSDKNTTRIHLTVSEDVKKEFDEWLAKKEFANKGLPVVNDLIFKSFLERANDYEFVIRY